MIVRRKMREQATLIKFGKYEYICQLRDEGLLYLNNLPYFWEIEDEELRGDSFDGVAEVRRGRNGTATPVGDTENPLKVTNWVLRVHPSQPERINIFCMYAVRPSLGSFPVEERNFQFGDYALVLTNPQEFIERISSRLTSQGVKHRAALVDYVDDEYTGEFGPFKKLSRFSYQSEWRLVCYDGPGEVRRLHIGSIAEISAIVPSAEVNQKIRELLTIVSN